MVWDEQKLEAALLAALTAVANQRGAAFAQQITPIILGNLSLERVQFFLNGGQDCLPADYVWHVVGCYDAQHDYVQQVVVEQSTAVWLPLFGKMKRWANAYIRRSKYDMPTATRQQLAQECATLAAMRLLAARFPYDTEFDAWVHVIVRNVTWKTVEKNNRQDAKQALSIDEWQDWDNAASFWTKPAHDKDVELRHDFSDAIDQMRSDARRQIIMLRYYKGLSLAEIAQKMGRSMSATYKLHFDALQELRKILGDKWNRDE